MVLSSKRAGRQPGGGGGGSEYNSGNMSRLPEQS